MPKSLSFDLRSRVLAAIDEGFSCRQAAARFGVSASSAIRWQALRRLGGDARPKPQGGDRLSHRTERHGDLIRALLVETPDITLLELKAHLRKAAERTVAGLRDAIGRLIDLFTPQECTNFYAAAGYDAT